MRRIHLLLWLVWMLVVACGRQPANVGHTNVENVRSVDMSAARAVSFDSLAEIVRVVPLLQRPDVLMRSPSRVEVTPSFIYVFSPSDACVFVFDNQGGYVNSIRSGSRRVGYPLGFYVDRNAQELLVFDADCKGVKRFSLDGATFLGDGLQEHAIVAMELYNEHAFLISDGNMDKKVPGCVGLIGNGELPSYYAIKNPSVSTDGYVAPSVFVRDSASQSIYTLLHLSDTIFVTRPEHGIPFEPFCVLDFGGNLLTLRNYKPSGYTDKEFAELLESKRYITNLTCFYSSGGYLFIKTVGKESKLYALRTSDFLLIQVPSLFNGFPIHHAYYSIHGASENSLYFLVESDRFVAHYQEKGVSENQVVNAFLDADVDCGNYLLIECRFKN